MRHDVARLTVTLGLVMMPAVAAAQSFAVFTGKTGNTSHIYRLELDSLTITQLTTSTANEMEAAISPDGSQIVFVSDRDKTRALYLASATAPGREWKRLTTSKGHYARPSFAPDATRVAARFTTDSRDPATHTRIVSIAIADGTETVLVDAAKEHPADPDESRVTVVDHPAWIGPSTLAFVVVSYLEPYTALRMNGASIWRVDARTKKSSHLLGTGFSGYDAEGNSHGFSATMPRLDGKRLSFVGLLSIPDRVPMVARLDGTGDRRLQFQPEGSFIGPCLSVGTRWLYGFSDDNDTWHLALTDEGGKNRGVIRFNGDAREPAVAPANAPGTAPAAVPAGAVATAAEVTTGPGGRAIADSMSGEMTFVAYTNARFQYTVDVPDHFVKGEAPANDDGRTFTSPHDAGTIAVFGAHNALNQTVAQLKAAKDAAYTQAGAVVTYRADVGNGFVISGTQGTTVFYEKVVFSKDRATLATVLLRYPEALKARYDIIVNRASKTLRVD